MKIERMCMMAQMVPDGGERSVKSVLGYDTSDPYAFTWTFYPPEEPDGIQWTMSREHLRAGALSPSRIGTGGVRFGACVFGQIVHVEIDDAETDQVVILHAAYDTITYFLAATAKEVPFGKEDEYVDMDKLVGQLLSEGS